MKTKPLTFLLSLTFLFLFSGDVFGNDPDFQDALDAANRGDYKTAYDLWLPLAEQGNAYAQGNLGMLYDNGGQGVPQDYQEAVKWYRLAAEQGLAEAQYTLGDMFHKGHGVQQNYSEAVKWYQRAAEQDNADAKRKIYDLAKIPISPALNVLIEDAEFGSAEAKRIIYDLAKKSVPKALEFLVKNAEQGYADAQNKLGEVFFEGLGLPQNYLQAHIWFNLSGSQGNRNALRNRNKVEKHLSREQLLEAQKMAEKWKPKKKSNDLMWKSWKKFLTQ